MGRLKFSELDNVVPLFDRPDAIPKPVVQSRATLRTRGPHYDYRGERMGRGAFLYEEDSPRDPWTPREPGDQAVARALGAAVRAGWVKGDQDILVKLLMERCPRGGGIRIGVECAAYETAPERWAWMRRRRD